MSQANQTRHDFETELLTDKNLENKLILYNDYVNTFDWVIESLMKVCKHTFEQAEQCSYIIHHKGKYAVKHGSLEALKPLKDAITERGLTATIE